MLAAAGEIFAEVGFDAATTEAIAERAEVSIGSLYQYFPNKEALFEALADGYHERESAVIEKQMVAAVMTGATWEETIDRMIDGFAYLQKTDPAFRAVWLNWMHSPRVVATGLARTTEFAERAEALALHYAPDLPLRERRILTRMVVEVMSSMIFAAVRLGPEVGGALLEETKVLLRRYLEPIAGPSARARKGKGSP